MKKIILLLWMLVPFLGFAQLKLIAEGPVFDEPETGFGKIVLMKNGNTAFLHITLKDGINVRIYDAQYKQIANTSLKPAYGKLKSAQVEGVYDVGGTLTAFISEVDEKKPTLYKLRIDGTSGKLLQEETVGSLNKLSMGEGYAMAFGGVPIPDFLVRKDPASDNYGVIRYNTFETDNKKRVELVQYGNDGAETHRTFLSSQGAKYKYTQILDFVIVGQDAFALIYSYNTANSGGAANELLFAAIKNGTVTYNNIGQSVKHRINDGLLRYNPKTGNFAFLTTEVQKTKTQGLGSRSVTYFDVQLSIIDGSNYNILKSIDGLPISLHQKFNKIFKEDNGYSGMPQQLYVNNDGSISVLYEEITKEYQVTNTGMRTPTGEVLGTAAIARFTENGDVAYAELIPKNYKISYSVFGRGSVFNNSMAMNLGQSNMSFNLAQADNAATALSGGSQFKKLAYLDGNTKSYMLINDVAENEERILKGKLTTIQSVGDCDAYCYDLSNTTTAAAPVLPRTLVFRKEGKKDRNLAVFGVSDFDRESGIYSTLKLEKGKGVKLVWMKE